MNGQLSISDHAAIFREVDKFDFWNTQPMISEDSKPTTVTPLLQQLINQARPIDLPASESKRTSKNTVKMQSAIANKD
jgi:hypothetical protein